MKRKNLENKPYLPKSINFMPDVPKDGIWNIVNRLADIFMRRYTDARDNKRKRFTNKELKIMKEKDELTCSESNIIARATPKQREDAFGMFMDKVLEDTKFQEQFSEALDFVKTTKPEKFLDVALQMHRMRHPVDKDVNIDVNMQVKQTIYSKMHKQYQYSQMIEEADLVDESEEESQRQEQKELAMPQLSSSFQNEDSDSTFAEQNEELF